MNLNFKLRGFTLYGSFGLFTQSSKYLRMTPLDKSKAGRTSGFTLIELLVVISIIALLSSVVVAAIAKSRVKARDTARIQNARQLALALEQYEQSNSTYKISNAGLNNEGGGYVSKGSETPGYTNSVVSALKSAGYYTSDKLIDPVFGTDNYYVGLCTSTNAYNVFVKLEQTEFNTPTSTVANTCGGNDAVSEGFTFVGSTTGGNAGVITPTVNTNGFAAAYEQGMGPDTVQSGGGTGGGGFGAVGAIDDLFNSGGGANDTIVVSRTQSDGKIVIGGDFDLYDGTARNYIARIKSDGSLDNTFNPGSGADNTLRDLIIQPDGKILIIGGFASYDGTARNYIARLNSNGSLDTDFNIGSGPDDLISGFSLQPDGKIVIVGGFTSYNGTARNYIARLNSDGSLDTDFNIGSGFNDGALRVIIQPDGKIVVSGIFSSYNGVAKKSMARLNSDGSLDSDFNTGSGTEGMIESLSLQPDGKIFIGGPFAVYDGVAREWFARLNSNGSVDSSFNTGSGVNGPVYSFLTQPDGKIFIGGTFTTYNGVSRMRLARINSDGSLDTGFDLGTGNKGNIKSISLQSDGKIVVAGWFTSLGGVDVISIARIK